MRTKDIPKTLIWKCLRLEGEKVTEEEDEDEIKEGEEKEDEDEVKEGEEKEDEDEDL